MALTPTLYIVGLLGFGLANIPGVLHFSGPPPADTITVNIGVGGLNSSAPLPTSWPHVPKGETLGGTAPVVSLYDNTGQLIGRSRERPEVIAGGAISLKITGDGKQGGTGSLVPTYIQLSHTGTDPICISWITTTSAGSSNGDFRSWNAATARHCDIPWYPSTAPMGGVQILNERGFQPPCFWLDGARKHNAHFPVAMSANLFHFNFPGSGGEAAAAMAKQWNWRPDTLCEAPARQSFYRTAPECIPYYPTGLAEIGMKDPDYGYDYSFTAIKQGHTSDCKNMGEPFKKIQLPTGVSPQVSSILSTAVLQKTLDLGPLAGRAAATASTTASGAAATASSGASTMEKEPSTQATMGRTILDRRAETRHLEPHLWCQQRQLVVSEHPAHSARDVCASGSSWGPDMVSLDERLFCDMCTRKVYPVCGPKKKQQAGEFGILGGTLCFDLKTKELRVQGKKVATRDVLERKGVKQKRYEGVQEWKR